MWLPSFAHIWEAGQRACKANQPATVTARAIKASDSKQSSKSKAFCRWNWLLLGSLWCWPCACLERLVGPWPSLWSTEQCLSDPFAPRFALEQEGNHTPAITVQGELEDARRAL